MKKMIAMFALLALVAVPVFADDPADNTVTVDLAVQTYVSVSLSADLAAVQATGGNGSATKDILVDFETNDDATIDLSVSGFAGSGLSNSLSTDSIAVTFGTNNNDTNGENAQTVVLAIDYTTDAQAGSYSGTVTASITPAP